MVHNIKPAEIVIEAGGTPAPGSQRRDSKMSLDWDATKVKDVDTLHDDEAQWHITHDLIWVTMSVGIREITDTNFIEFYARMKYVYTLIGAEMKVTPADIERRIGLRTNANVETELQFIKRHGMHELRRTRNEAMGELNRQAINA